MAGTPGRHGPLASRIAVSLVGAALLLLPACSHRVQPTAGRTPTSPAGAAGFPVTITDDEGVSVTLPSPPKRIVTFAPSNTEIVFALGLGEELVGVSGKFDDYPPAARDVDRVGGAGEFGVDPNIEKVVALQPDLVLAIAGGEQWKKRLRDLGMAVFTVNATDYDDLVHDIGTVGRLTGAVDAAKMVTDGMSGEEDRIREAVSAEPAVSCFFEAYYPPLTTVGPRTFIFDLLLRAGCDPVSAGAKSDYPEWSIDRLVSDRPEVYLVASESGVSPEAVARRPGFGAIPAVSTSRVYLVSSDLISRPGPRVVEGLQSLAHILHPAVA